MKFPGVLVLVAVLIPSGAWCADWTVLTADANLSSIVSYMPPVLRGSTGNMRRIWIRLDFKTPQNLPPLP